MVLFLAAVDCSSRVTYLPFMAKFNAMYLTSYFIGEGLSGFFPSIIALAQGVGGNPECIENSYGNGTYPHTADPRFPVDVFFYMLFVFTLISMIAFYCLNNAKLMEGAYASKQIDAIEGAGDQKSPDRASSSSGSTSSDEHSIFEPPKPQITLPTGGIGDQPDNNNDSRSPASTVQARPLGLLEDGNTSENSFLMGMSQQTFVYLLCLQVVVCMLSNGIFPSIQSYSCLPYGNVAYHLSITLSNMANPTVCFLVFFIPPPTKKTITSVAALSFLLSAYVMATAVLSPKPPLMGKASGEILLVCC